MKKLILPVILVVLGLAVGAGGAFAASRFVGGGAAVAGKAAHGDDDELDKKPAQRHGIMLPLKERIVNLADPGNMRYLKATIVLELYEPGQKGELPKGEEYKKKQDELAKELRPQNYQIEDEITAVLTAKTTADLMGAEGKQKLKDELKERLSKVIHEYRVLNVLFTDLIIQ
jgi:flagellar FliL protein